MTQRAFPDFWKLSEADQDKVLNKLHGALLWKGWDKSHDQRAGRTPSHANTAVQEIATIFAEAGHEQEEYT